MSMPSITSLFRFFLLLFFPRERLLASPYSARSENSADWKLAFTVVVAVLNYTLFSFDSKAEHPKDWERSHKKEDFGIKRALVGVCR